MFARRFVPSLIVVAVILSASTLLTAQDVASITGVITDQSGAVIPGATVKLSNPGTGVVYTTTTNQEGSYTLNQVKPGPNYKIEVSHKGFKAVVISGLYLNVDSTRVQNAQLSAGADVETVEVSAASENVTLDTTDATVGNNFQVQFLDDLPIEYRDSPAQLFYQQPGVTLDGSVTGARTDQSRVTVDGLDVNDMATGEFGAIIAYAPVDSVQEFRGVTAGYLSNSGGGGGGQFELVTRSGTNNFHGNLNEYHRDTDFEANDWFNNNSGVPRPPLIRNQFGGNIGGPVLKNRMFFFFDYNARRDTISDLVERTVPEDSFRNGTLNYINTSNALESLSSSQVAALDPLAVGFNSSLLSLFSSRYPNANDFSGSAGDLINFAGFRFNYPTPVKENNYVARVDYNLGEKMKIFGRGTVSRFNATESPIWFPGDPQTSPYFDRSYAWVVSHIWTISANKVNQAYYGETYEDLDFPNTYNPTGANQFGTFGGNGTGGAIIVGPYASAINAQGRTYPIPVFRDDFTWDKGKHDFHFGGSFKWITPNEFSILNYNSPTIGLGGATTQLNAFLRPGDVGGGNATALYDSSFALALAPYTAVSATYNYNSAGNPVPQGSGQTHVYRYYETELYAEDTWKLNPKLTLTYGLRWQFYSVPYDTHGIESVENTNFNTYFGDRLAQSAAGQSGNLTLPLISYSLGGKANHAPGYYKPQYTNFAPRVAFAYSPDSRNVISGGIGIVYDQTVINAVQYQQSQFSYLFQAGIDEPFGTSDPVASLASDARFTGLNNPPAPPPAPTITKPFFPYVSGTGSSAVPYGLANLGAFNEIIDPNLKNPYYMQYNFGLQHQFHSGFLLRMTYVGREGRRLLGQADAEQLVDFPDAVSGQEMSAAFTSLTQQLRAGVNPLSVTPQPWYENVLPPGIGAYYGFGTNSALVADVLSTYVQRGDFADTTAFLSYFGLLPPNVGMAAQFSENTFYTNKGSSSYNGMLTTLHKNVGYGLQFDLNYTWSHSVDNVSLIANAAAFGGYGFICDVNRPRECRGNSDFDVTQYFNGDFIYDLPFGRGRAFGSDMPRWLNEVAGGWSISGLPSRHTGNPYFASSNAFVAGYANDAPATLTGPISDLKIHLNGGKGQPLYAYSSPQQALADFQGPLGFNIGSRNNLRGPGYWSIDLGLAKTFPIIAEKLNLKFRADAFNALNHPSFNPPSGTDITESSSPFGVVSSTASSPRVLQLALRLEF